MTAPGATVTAPGTDGAPAAPPGESAPVSAAPTSAAPVSAAPTSGAASGAAAPTGVTTEPPQPGTAAPEAAGRAAPVRGRATLPGSTRPGGPETGAPPRPGESPWAQPPQRPTSAPAAPAQPDPSPQGGPAQPDGPAPPPGAPAPPAAGAATPGARDAEPPTAPVGPYPPTMGGTTYPAAARPVSGYPAPGGPPVPPPPTAPGTPATYPAPGTPTTYPAAPGYAPPPGYPTYPPAPPVPAPPVAATPSGWPPPGAPGPVPPPPHHPGVTPVPTQPYPEAPGVHRVPPPPAPSYSDPLWTPDSGTPTAEEFAQRRAVRPPEPVAQMGVRAALNKTTLGLVKLPPGRHEQELKQDIETIRRNFGGLRQVTVVNPKGGAGKTVAILLLAMTFGQKRGGYVLAWDNNETQGTLGMRAQQDFHSRTVRDLLRDLHQFKGAHGRVGDLSQYVRSQGEGMFDVLASDESATGGEMLTAAAFAEIREVVSRFYKLIFVDTGNNVRAQNWQAAIDATDQLVVTMSARNDSAETAARMLDHLEQSGRQRLVRQAVTVVSMPPSRKEIDLPPIQRHFAARTRAVLLAPYERLIDTGEPIRYAQLSSATREAWLKIAAAVAEGL
ncbi:chromosome partitioning protein [Micromonospora sp. HM5-17]|uniref:chromosome partitioning protein n=1 Tax=Micromonospora sp. HM5-17 TaxID=2487710 RepID=UPI003511057D